jgi:CheY-like chemotaxis protein
MHGGAIGFASKAKVGSTFSFYVKCRKSKVSPQVISTATEAANLSIRTTASALSNRPHEGKDDSPSLARMPSEDTAKAASELYILVVEDNLVNQRVLAKQLRNLGMKVAVANHGGEALEYLSTTTCCLNDSTAKPLSLILMDWEMPVMDGLTCVREIRKLQVQGVVTRHVPVIAVTANVRAEQVSKALDAGMDDVISKPFRIPELSACIHKTMASTANVQ